MPRDLAILALTTVALCACVSDSPRGGGTPAAPSEPVPPPTELLLPGKRADRLLITIPEIEAAYVECGLLQREVILTWFRRFEDGTKWMNRQKVEVAFFPTSAVWAGESRLCVSGRDMEGDTVIQVWTLESGAELRAPFTNGRAYPDTVIPVLDRRTLYEDDVEGLRLVRMAFPNHGDPDQVFLIFEDSRSLYTIDVTTGALVERVSARPHATLPHHPALLRDYRQRTALRHRDQGYVYVLFEDDVSDQYHSLLIHDRNCDGILEPDSVYQITIADWQSMQLGDGSRHY